MKLRVLHRTNYRYSEPVTLGHNQLHLTPRAHARQRCLTARVQIDPLPAISRHWGDVFGNEVIYFTLEEPHRELEISLQAVLEILEPPLLPNNPFSTWEEVRYQLQNNPRGATLEAAAYTFPSPHIPRLPEVRAYAEPSFAANRSCFECVRELTERIFNDFKYDPQATNVTTTLRELLRIRRGVCQDFTHLQIACLRSFGLAARYVSGYLVTHPPPGKVKLVGADASHAWLSVYFPEQGWIDFDPTNNCLPQKEHVTLAWGRDYSDVAPIKGLYLGGGHSLLQVTVDISEFGTS